MKGDEKIARESTYARVLADHRLAFTTSSVWLKVRGTSGADTASPSDVGYGGWKLHLSSIPTEATALLRLTLPYLRRWRLHFKLIRSESLLISLNAGELGDSQIGKFVTIYPDDDEKAVDIAKQLVRMTAEFHGPKVPTDQSLGGVVYTRFGAFEPLIVCNRLGIPIEFVRNPSDSRLLVDARSIPFRVPDGVVYPFSDHSKKGALRSIDVSPLIKGYRPVRALSRRGTGSVLLALDLRQQALVRPVILKVARPFCSSDQFGRDARTRLRFQETICSALSSIDGICRTGHYFEDEAGNGYLPIEHFPGMRLDHWARQLLNMRPWAVLDGAARELWFRVAQNLTRAVAGLHNHGVVHRDLSPGNVLVNAYGQVCIVDFELAFRKGDDGPPFGVGTVAFMSPQQAARGKPSSADDIFSLGCLLTVMLVGMPPTRLAATAAGKFNSAIVAWSGLPRTNALPTLIARCLSPDADSRPTASEFNICLSEVARSARVKCSNMHDTTDDSDVSAAIEGTLRHTVRHPTLHIWMSRKATTVPHDDQFDISENAYDGIPGLVLLLARGARGGFASPSHLKVARSLSSYVMNKLRARRELLPGLYFGRAGIAVAICEAVSADLIGVRIDSNIINDMLSVNDDWYDITHGAAGRGLAAIECASMLDSTGILKIARDCADYLCKAQRADGSWIVPPGVDGMSGKTLTGFAHGVAGIAYFLLECGHVCGHEGALAAVEKARRWLDETAVPVGSAVNWPTESEGKEMWQWWCHGGPGIALFYLRCAERQNDEEAAEIGRRALRVLPQDLRSENLSQCHGLSGIGEIYLEAYRVLGEFEWLQRAEDLRSLFLAVAYRGASGSLSWNVEGESRPNASLMTGTAGLTHFLLRLCAGPNSFGFPFLASPIDSCGVQQNPSALEAE